MTVLTYLASRSKPVASMAIARQCRMPQSSAYRLLNAMRERGFVEYYERERAWGLGRATLHVAAGYRATQPLARAARPVLRSSAERSGVPVGLASLVEGRVALEVHGDGHRLAAAVSAQPAPCASAVGLALLAASTEEELEALYPPGDPVLARVEGRPLLRRRMRELVGEVRRRGCAMDSSGGGRITVALPWRGAGVAAQPLALVTECAPATGVQPWAPAAQLLRSVSAALEERLAR